MPRIYDAPKGCLLAANYGQVSYQDCYVEELPSDGFDGPVDLFLKMMHPMPWWVRSLMRVRNFIVRFFGLKTGSGMDEIDLNPAHYHVGSHIDFFKITNLSEHEVVVSADDRHLTSSFSLLICEEGAQKRIYMTSIVRTQEKLGDVYMFVIAPFHRLIVSYLLKRLVRKLKGKQRTLA
ncbi:MAG: DUF2867 domain-containing protein [Sneathiella sp.]